MRLPTSPLEAVWPLLPEPMVAMEPEAAAAVPMIPTAASVMLSGHAKAPIPAASAQQVDTIVVRRAEPVSIQLPCAATLRRHGRVVWAFFSRQRWSADAQDGVEEERRPSPQRIDEDGADAQGHRDHGPNRVDESGGGSRNSDPIQAENQHNVLR